MGFIYKITNKVNGKYYIGKTVVGVEKRWEAHQKCARQPRQYQSKFYDALAKYGADNFSVETIEECTNEVIDDREKYWIKKLDAINLGYNISLGGDGRIVVYDSEKEYIIMLWRFGLTIERISETIKRNHKLVKRVLREKGVTDDEITERAVYESGRKKVKKVYSYRKDGTFLREYNSLAEMAEDIGVTVGDLSHTARGRCKTIRDLQVRYFKAERIEPLGDKYGNRSREIYQYTLDGEYVAHYRMIKDAAKAVGLVDGHGITFSCKDEKTTAGGFQWRYFKAERIEPSKRDNRVAG